MKTNLLILLFFIITAALLFSACNGDKEVIDLKITDGLITEYKLNDTPDFSKVKAMASFNDGSVEEITSEKLVFGSIDTSVIGEQQLTVSYLNYSFTVSINVKGNDLDSSFSSTDQIVTAVSLPESLALWYANKKDFTNPNCEYVVGDDNPFIFTLKLSVYSYEGEKIDVSSYTSRSTVYLGDSDTPLAGDKLNEYVTVDEENNSFDFTEAAVGKSFTISTRPRDGVDGHEEEMTKSLTVTVVDGYNVYKAYELNFITNANSETLCFDSVYPNETRQQYQIVDDFLHNEKGVTRPESLVSIVLHNDLEITPEDIPSEYFLNKDRNNEFYDYISVFHHALTEENKTFTVHGNYFAIYSHLLPCVVDEGLGNQDNQVSSGQLLRFTVDTNIDKNYDHTEYVTNIQNVMFVDDDPQSDNLDTSDKAMRGLIAIKSFMHTVNLNNVKIQSFYVSFFADYDHHTVNITDSVFYNSWQNHIFLLSSDVVNPSSAKFDYEKYPRLSLNVNNSSITKSGGPAIIMQTISPPDETGTPSGPLVNISSDSTVESWVTGEEAWFEAFNITSVAQMIKNFERNVQTFDSSFIKEEINMVNGNPKTFKLMNIVAVNLMFPDMSEGLNGIFNQMQGKTDIDGKVIIGGHTVLDMDDHLYNGVASNFGDLTISNLKSENSANHLFSTTSGGIACVGPDRPFSLEKNSIEAKSDNEFLTIYFYTMGIILGNYHQI